MPRFVLISIDEECESISRCQIAKLRMKIPWLFLVKVSF